MDISCADIVFSFSIVQTVQRLRTLVICHDRAVLQMQLLCSRIAEVERRRKLYSKLNSCADDVSLSLRQQVMEGILEAYKYYRLTKWAEIQSMIAIIFSTFDPEVVHYVLQTATLRRDFFVDSDDDESDEGDIDDESDDIDTDFQELWIEDTEMRMQY